jgi:hypothetical protein
MVTQIMEYLFETESDWLPVILLKEKQHHYVGEVLDPSAILTYVNLTNIEI